MNTPKRFLVFLIIIQFYFCFAGCTDLLGQYHFDSWTTDNGLPQNGVREITQTPDGYLWFTTFDGLVRFDGVKFTTFNKSNTKGITNNRFIGVNSDKNGTLYATTMEDGILTVYRDGVFSSYSSEQVPGDYIKFTVRDENGEAKFLVSDEELNKEFWYYLRDGKFVLKEEFKKQNNAATTIEGTSGIVWTVSKNKVVETRNGNSIDYSYKVESSLDTTPVFTDSKGGLWVGGAGLAYFKDGKILNFQGKSRLPSEGSDYHSFWEESDGSIWVANGGRFQTGLGLVRYKEGEISIFGKEQGLTDANIQSIFRDRENNVWLATAKGLNRLKKSVISSLSVAEGLMDSEVYPIYRDSKNAIWVGMSTGLNVYQKGKFEKVDLGGGWNGHQLTVQSLFEDSNGKMWIGVAGKIYLAQNNKSEAIKAADGYTPFSILQDKEGNVWAATDRGILRFKDYELEKIYTVKDGLPQNYVNLVYEDFNGHLWFGGYGGLSRFENGKFINYTKEQGLTGNLVRTIYEEKNGTFWIGTYDEGLSRFKDGKFINYKTEDGLYSNGVFAIEEDARGYFWISSNQGIYRVAKQNLNDFADGKVEKIISIGYDKSDGMLNIECNGGRQPASLRDENGHFWFPTQDGVAIVDPNSEIYNLLPPSVVIESATVEREKINIRKGLIIEPGQKNIEISFTGISLIKSNQIKFQYKLEGHDSEWIDAGENRTAYYSYLPPGDYQFRVKAVNSDGIWNEEGATLALKLQPFFYQTNLFYLLCIGIGAFVLLVVWKISVHQLEARERLLEKLVNEKTEALKKANVELQKLANYDGLTGVGNRRFFEEFLSTEWLRAARNKNEISLILLDIDHFKLFNDTYGHQAGDDCLKEVADTLRKSTNRPTDLVARYGGEEFAIILGNTDSKGALSIAEQVIEKIRSLQIIHDSSETSGNLTISIGVATTFAEAGMTEAKLVKAADESLYKAKESGRNQVISNDLTKAVQEKSVLDDEYIVTN